jgi:hypothetical protein
MNPALKTVFARELAAADAAEKSGDTRIAFAHLERAHIVGQRYFLTHLLAHFRMLRIATHRRDARETRGQILRLLAVIPGYLLGWVPKGNTGGANVSALKPMPMPEDIAPLLQDYQVWRDVAFRLAAAALATGIYFAWSSYGGQPSGFADQSDWWAEDTAALAVSR